MSPILHKFFIHGPEIIKHALLRNGQLSETPKKQEKKISKITGNIFHENVVDKNQTKIYLIDF